jgi:hypothetical protein
MLRSNQKLICKSIKFDHRAVFGLCSEWRVSKKLSKKHQTRSYTQARKEAAMAVIPEDPGIVRARLERTNQFASLARQAVTQARQAARGAAREAAARDMTDRHGTCADE